MEQQSTPNLNMPYRQLEYAVSSFRILNVFEHLDNEKNNKKQNRFGPSLMNYPKVEFYVLYNGKRQLKESEKQLLVDLGDIVVKAQVVDIRFCNLPEKTALDTNNRVSGYAFFVQRFEELKEEGNTPHQAYYLAIEESKERGYLTDVWSRKECVDMFKECYDRDDDMIEVGIEKGRDEEATKIAIKMLKSGLDVNMVAEMAERPVEWVKGLIVTT